MEIHSAIAAASYSAPRQASPARSAEPVGDEDVVKRAGMAPDEDAVADGKETERVSGASGSPTELTTDELQQLQELKNRDTEVRAHEAAHVAAGGPYVTGGASYTYQQGPDGQRYAIGGEVGIDISAVSGDPEATIQKAQTVLRAALAPAEPSSQDHAVAAAASAMQAEALSELIQLQQAEREDMAKGAVANKAPSSDEQGGNADSLSAEEDRRLAAETELGEAPSADEGRLMEQTARERLEQRIAGFFASPAGENFSQFA